VSALQGDEKKSASLDMTAPFAMEYFEEGFDRGRVNAVLIVLDARGIAVPEKSRERFLSQTDRYLIGRWMTSASYAPNVEYFFHEKMYSYDSEWCSDYARRYDAAGYARGLAVALIRVLGSCGITLPDEDRVIHCTDAVQLERWLRRAPFIRKAEELFA
jgi:hypothetical protein